MIHRGLGVDVLQGIGRKRCPINYGRTMFERLYRSLVAKYRSQGSAPHVWHRAFEHSINMLALVIAKYKNVRFPEQRVGGWWWTGRWRFEFVMGWLESESVSQVRQLVRPGTTVLDVGAHIGFYTRLLSDLVGPDGRVLAFEPHPDNLALLRHNTRRCPNVEINAGAVGDTDGALTLHVSIGHSNHSLVDGFTEALESISVQGVRLDSFLGSRGVGNVGFVKIDVEGAEPLVLAGMLETIRANPDLAMLIEFNPPALNKSGTSPDQFLRILKDLGFEVRDVESGRRLTRAPEGEAVVNLVCLPTA